MSESPVRDWCRKFRDEQIDVHDKGRQGWYLIMTNELIQKVDQLVSEKRCFMISDLSDEFSQILRLSLLQTVAERFGYHKFYACLVPKTTNYCLQSSKNGSFWCSFCTAKKRKMNFSTEPWLGTRHGFSSRIQKWRISLKSGYKFNLQTNPENSNEHFWTKTMMATLFWNSKGILLMEFKYYGTQ